MKYTININDVKSIDKIPEYWKNDDYINILEELEFSDARNSDPDELQALLEMAMSDLEPHEAAEVLLKYKLKDNLKEGQIQQLSHEMADDNESEGYSDIGLHYALFNINQLLYSAFNGIFPHAKATKVEFELSFKDDLKHTISKALALKSLCDCLTETNPIVRLFEDQLQGKKPFSDAEKIVWELHDSGSNKYTLLTSDYWINKEDIEESEFSGVIKLYEEKEE